MKIFILFISIIGIGCSSNGMQEFDNTSLEIHKDSVKFETIKIQTH